MQYDKLHHHKLNYRIHTPYYPHSFTVVIIINTGLCLTPGVDKG